MNNSNEENAIREAINYYVEGTRTGNVETLKEGFHEQAILCGYLGDELIAAPIVGFITNGSPLIRLRHRPAMFSSVKCRQSK